MKTVLQIDIFFKDVEQEKKEQKKMFKRCFEIVYKSYLLWNNNKKLIFIFAQYLPLKVLQIFTTYVVNDFFFFYYRSEFVA